MVVVVVNCCCFCECFYCCLFQWVVVYIVVCGFMSELLWG